MVFFHGNGGSLYGSGLANQAIVEAGFGALLVEYRGYGGNPGEPSEHGLYLDGEASIAWLKKRGISAEDIVIASNSIGGGVAVEMAKRHDPSALILVAPFTSLPEVAQSSLWWMPARYLVQDQYLNAEKIVELQMPVLVQHGDADDLVSYEHGKRLAQLAPKGEFQRFEGSGHGLSGEHRSQVARRDWLIGLSD